MGPPAMPFRRIIVAARLRLPSAMPLGRIMAAFAGALLQGCAPIEVGIVIGVERFIRRATDARLQLRLGRLDP